MNKEEVWKPIANYPRYEVSNLGRVRSYATSTPYRIVLRKKPRVLHPTFDKSCGYYRIGLFEGGHHKLEFVHRLVLTAFIGECPPGMEACHNDGNRINNHLENLRWDTRKNNFVDRENHGHTYKGERHHNTKFTKEDIREIRKRAKNGETHKAIAKSYGVTRQTISYIVRRDTWKHV